MRYKQGQKKQTRERILEAAGRKFRKDGYSGAGVDGLAKEAGVTSGAFYGHFDSKATAFRESIASGLEQLRGAVEQYQKEHNNLWLDEFAKLYLGEKRTCDLAESCALQSLTPEVGRSDELTRSVFQSELLKVANSVASGLPPVDGKPDLDSAWVYLAMLVGGVTLARAINDQELAEGIASAIRNAMPLNNKGSNATKEQEQPNENK